MRILRYYKKYLAKFNTQISILIIITYLIIMCIVGTVILTANAKLNMVLSNVS